MKCNALQCLLLLLSFAAPVAAQDMAPISGQPIINSPQDIGDRPATARISMLRFSPAGVHVEFTRKEDPNRWPDVVPPGWEGDIQYTLCIGMHISGQWYYSCSIEFWHTLDASGGDVTVDNQILRNWTYDCGPMARQPAPGETVAFLVTAGDQRKKDAIGVYPNGQLAKERSYVVTVPFPSQSNTTYTFPTGPSIPPPVPPPVPEPLPLPPVVTPPPQPPVDLTRLELKVDALLAEVTEHRAESKRVYKDALTWLGKYVLPAATALLAGMRLGS